MAKVVFMYMKDNYDSILSLSNSLELLRISENQAIFYLHSIENLAYMFRGKILNITYTENSIYKWVVATVRHSQPMATEEYDINVSVTEAEIVPLA